MTSSGHHFLLFPVSWFTPSFNMLSSPRFTGIFLYQNFRRNTGDAGSENVQEAWTKRWSHSGMRVRGLRWRTMHHFVLAASLWFALVLSAYGLCVEFAVTPKSLGQGNYVFSISTDAARDATSFQVVITAKTNDFPSDSSVSLNIITNWPGGSQITAVVPPISVTLKKEGHIWRTDFTVPREQLKNPGLCFIFTEPVGFVVNGKKRTDSAIFYEIKLQDFLKP